MGPRRALETGSIRLADGTLVQVCDPIEESYPFDGRVRFFRPGEERERLIGRAESIRDGYLEKFAQRRKDMTDLAAECGWRFISHKTSDEARTTLGLIAHGFSLAGVSA